MSEKDRLISRLESKRDKTTMSLRLSAFLMAIIGIITFVVNFESNKEHGLTSLANTGLTTIMIILGSTIIISEIIVLVIEKVFNKKIVRLLD